MLTKENDLTVSVDLRKLSDAVSKEDVKKLCTTN